MQNAVFNYFTELMGGQAWNRFWFEPRSARTLGLIRLATGVIALYTLLCYTPDLITFFGPNGLVPTATAKAISFQEPMAGGNYQYHQGDFLLALNYLAWFENEPPMLWTAHAVGIAVVAAFLAGYRARITSVFALIVILTYIHRGSVLCSQLEPILAMVMAYLCLGPSGDYYSVDRWLAARQGHATSPAPSIGANIAIRLMQVHLSAIYMMMAFGKLVHLGAQGAVWWTGDATWWLMSKPGASLIDLTWMYQYPFLVDFWTQAIVFFELGFGVLIWKRWARPMLLVVAVPMWLSLAVLTGLIPWPLMMLTANFCYLRFAPADERS